MSLAAVTYIGLPIHSGGAHSLGRMSRRTAYEKFTEFLATCTLPLSPVVCRFDANDVPGLGRLPTLERELARRFGDYAHLQEGQAPEALDFLDEIDPQPTNQWGMAPIWFRSMVTFRVIDPASNRPVPGQDSVSFNGVEYAWSVPLGTSRIHLDLHNRATLGIELCIPAGDAEVVYRVVPWLQRYLPFKFSSRQWREWTPTRSGSFRSRKLPGTPGL